MKEGDKVRALEKIGRHYSAVPAGTVGEVISINTNFNWVMVNFGGIFETPWKNQLEVINDDKDCDSRRPTSRSS
jgi:hypothetical protein